MNRLLLLLLGITYFLQAGADEKLTGTPIGSISVDYNSGTVSTTKNTPAMAFDGDLNTYYASYDRSNTWVGLDLGTPHVITRLGWSPRNDSQGAARTRLALFEGANEPDFSDALPLYLTEEIGTIGKFSYTDVNVSRAFRYVRYVGPNNARCNIAEVEFYGYEDEGDDSQFYQCTNLPLVVIHTKDNVEPYDKEHEIDGIISIISRDGTKLLCDTATTRLRGNASKDFPKKPYRIKFAHKHHVLGSPAKAKKWTLINNYGDKTLMRNIVAFELSRLLEMEYTPFCQPVDVMLNGEYKGCYQLCDQVEVNEDRIPVEKMDENGQNNGYHIEVDAYAGNEPVYFYSNRGNPVTIKYPDDDEITPQQRNYIKSHFNTMESKVFSTTYTNPTLGYQTYLDPSSFLRNLLVGEMSGNTDNFWSMHMYKYADDQLLYTGPCWDFDLAFENDNRTYPISSLSNWIYYTKGSCAGNIRDFVTRILTDANAKQRLTELWGKARYNGLTEESLCNFVDETAQQLDHSQRLNFMRWPILNTKVHQNVTAWGSYEREVKVITDYIKWRVAWMDKKVGYDPVGIESLMSQEPATDEDKNNTIYDLSGRQVSRESLSRNAGLKHGIYIVGGKKIMK